MANNMMSDGNGVMVPQNSATAGTGVSMPSPTLITKQSGNFTDAQLLDMWKRWKKECFDQRWIFERQWMRNVWYLLNRQWIYYDSKRGQWQDKRLAKWIPRPVTNILKEGVQSVRANFASINYGANARPIGDDNAAVVTASVADDYAPILYEAHDMDHVMNEFDFWMLVTGNAWLHTYVEKDRINGMAEDPYEQCTQCQTVSLSSEIANSKQNCPACGGNSFMDATDENGAPLPAKQTPLPAGKTTALSPFEVAFPIMYERYDLSPITVRMRWRDQSYYEQHEELQQYAQTLGFGKTPQERTMQIFKTLPFQGDIGITPPYFASGGANVDTEGIVEYDVWVKPCADFPEGQVIRIAGDANPTILHMESESLPGPIPYHDAAGNPLFPFHMGRFEHVGGRPYGSSLIDPAIQKQDQLNQIDSHILMIIGRMANPVWLEPKGAEVEKFTGEPGLVVKWNPLVAGGQAKPERIPGADVTQSVFAYREMVKNEAEELMGTFDIMKGARPAGTEAYAAMSFLYERATGRYASAYKERADVHKGWFKDALNIEREFGPETRTRAVMAPTKGWAFKLFQKTQLEGNVEIMVEDGTLTPKTALGERAAIDHLAELGLLDPTDPDQKMAIFEKFGQTRLMPGIDSQVQQAWMMMEQFEEFLNDPQAIAQAQLKAQQTPPGQMPQMGPLVYRRWFNPIIHRNELIKWCLSDRGRAVFEQHPSALQMVDAYLTIIDIALTQEKMGILDAAGVMINTNPQQPQPGAQPGQQPPPGQQQTPQQQGPQGARQAMGNSNRASTPGVADAQSSPAGRGPAMPPNNAVTIAQRERAARYLSSADQGGQ